MTGMTFRATCACGDAAPYPGLDRWRQDRLTEARGILADVAHHSETLVILAARVVVSQADDAAECAEAIDLLRMQDPRPRQTVAAAAFPNGGST